MKDGVKRLADWMRKAARGVGTGTDAAALVGMLRDAIRTEVTAMHEEAGAPLGDAPVTIAAGQTWRGRSGEEYILAGQDAEGFWHEGDPEAWTASGEDLRSNYTLVSDAPVAPAPVPADAAEVARLRDTLAAAQATLAGIRSALRCSGSVGLVEWAAKIREDLDAAEMTVVEGTEILSEARAALNCGLTADERREPAILVTCRSRAATCAACEMARRDSAVAHFRARLKRREAELDAELDKAAKIRAALGCRDGERTIDVARDVAPRLLNAEIALNDALRERDAYHANARANAEQRDRFAADLGRLLTAVDRFGDTRIAWGPRMEAVLAEAQRIRDGGAPVDPRDAEIARLTRERDDWRRSCEAGRAERSAYHGAAMAEAARANDAEREREAMARALEVNAGLLRDAVAARDALVAAGVALRKAGPLGLWEQSARREALFALLPAEAPAITYGGPQPQSEAT